MEFLVEFEINPPEGTPKSEVVDREEAEAGRGQACSSKKDIWLRVWGLTAPDGGGRVLGLYRADNRAQLDRLLDALPAVRVDARHGDAARAASERSGSLRRRPALGRLRIQP